MSFDIEKQLDIGVPFHELLGIEITTVEEGRATATIEMSERLSSIEGQEIAHGGVVPALADAVAGVAINALNGTACPTVDLRTDYLLPATDDLTATAEVVYNGETTGVVDVKISDSNRTVVARARGVFKTSGDNSNALWTRMQTDSS